MSVSPAGSGPLRTALLTGVALAFFRMGVVNRRRELSWISYAFVAAAGLKLFAEDFRFGGSLGIFVSFTLFGAMLIAMPTLSQSAPPSNRAKRAGA